MIQVKDKMVNQLLDFLDDYLVMLEWDCPICDVEEKIKNVKDVINALKSKKEVNAKCQDGHM